jgi:hypothetical protein
MFDIIFSEDKEYDPLKIRMKMKSFYALGGIDTLGCVDPIRDDSDSISHVVDNDRYECAYDDTTEEKYEYIDTDYSYPFGYSIFLPFFY